MWCWKQWKKKKLKWCNCPCSAKKNLRGVLINFILSTNHLLRCHHLHKPITDDDNKMKRNLNMLLYLSLILLIFRFSHVPQAGLKLSGYSRMSLIFWSPLLPNSLVVGLYTWSFVPNLCDAGDKTQGSMKAMQVLFLFDNSTHSFIILFNYPK